MMKHCYKNHAHSFTTSDEVFVGDFIPSYLGLRRIVAVEGSISDDGYMWIETLPATLLQRIKFALISRKPTEKQK